MSLISVTVYVYRRQQLLGKEEKSHPMVSWKNQLLLLAKRIRLIAYFYVYQRLTEIRVVRNYGEGEVFKELDCDIVVS